MRQPRRFQVERIFHVLRFHALLNVGPHHVGRERQRGGAHANGVVDRVAHRRQNRKQGAFAGFFGAEGTLGVGGFDDDGRHVRHLMDRGNLVLEQVCVLQVPGAPVDHPLGEHLSQTHVA